MNVPGVPAHLRSTRIMIVDDKEESVLLLEKFLRLAGYNNIYGQTDPRKALLDLSDWNPDIMILDLHMPTLDGFAILDMIREMHEDTDYMPVIVVTADANKEVMRKALEKGAIDYLTKPLDREEVLLRVRNMAQSKFQYKQLGLKSESLEKNIHDRELELDIARIEILERLAQIAEYRDDESKEHTKRVGDISALIANDCGMSESMVRIMRKAAPLHDLGKVGIPESILLKPGKLRDDEFEIVKSHTTLGAEFLSGSEHRLLNVAKDIALCHHERFDGTGYPNKLSGQDIPLEARIASVADVFDTLTHVRPYRSSWPLDQAIAELRDKAGTQFDPELVRLLEQAINAGEIDETGLNTSRIKFSNTYALRGT